MDDFELIHSYSRTQALEDGVLIDVSDTAAEAGFRFPVAMTAAAYADTVAWTDEDAARTGTYQEVAGRLWDVVFMAVMAVRRARGAGVRADRLPFSLARVPREGRAATPEQVTLVLMIGPGDTPDPVVTIMCDGED